MKRIKMIISFVLLIKCFFIVEIVYTADIARFNTLQFQYKIKKDFLYDKMLHYQRYYQRLLQNNGHKAGMTKVYNRQIIIKLRNGKVFDAIKYDCIMVKYLNQFEDGSYIIVKVPQHQDYQKTLSKIQNDTAVEFAEPDYILKIQKTPNDTYYFSQWYLSKIRMPEVWDRFTEQKSTVVAVIDTGVDYTHPDLQGKVLPGINLVNGDNDPMDDNGHGTHVAGIIAAVTDNGIGIAGITTNAKILPIKAGDKDGNFTVSAVVEAILYAISQNVDVINLSLGGYSSSNLPLMSITDAIMQAYQKGIVVVAAAGNDATDEWTFPAAIPSVIAVSATATDDNRAKFGNFGSYIDIAAPGTNILSTIITNADYDNVKDGYTTESGTSVAAPIVSGIAALLKSIHPDWGPDEIEWALELSAYRKDPSILWDEYLGYGRVDAYAALSQVLPDLSQDAGDMPSNAKKITPFQAVTEKIDKPGDDDFFVFDVKTTSNVHIKISNVPSNLDVVGNVRKYSGDTVVYNYEMDNIGFGKSEEATLTLDPGQYYIWVYDFYNHWANSPYTVEVDVQPIDSSSQKKMEVVITNQIIFDIKLAENVTIKSVELLDGQQVIASTQDIKGTTATMVYQGEFSKTSYQIRVWSVDGRFGTASVQIQPSMKIVDIDASKGLLKIKAVVNGKLYKNGQYVKSMIKNEEYTFEGLTSDDIIQLIPTEAEGLITPATSIKQLEESK